MSDISFLIGSGFSIPDGLPSTNMMNNRLSHIEADEIMIHSSQNAAFLEGREYPNNQWERLVERNFVQEFLEFYNLEILDDDEEFDYEEFFDYYRLQLRNEDFDEDLVSFINDFKDRERYDREIPGILWNFDYTFNQLIQHMVSKWYEPVHLGKPYDPNYASFFELVENLDGDDAVFHFHNLNHDLLLEHFSSSDTFQGNISDGFREKGSPFYGELRGKDKYKVRLTYYDNHYPTKYRLYKLHGSINYYSLDFGDGDGTVFLKTKYGIDTTRLFKEVSSNGGFEYARSISFYYPEFLSGKTDKILRYRSNDYFENTLGNFEENLGNSELLIVIGYGFQDRGINNYLRDNFVNNEENKLIVIDVNEFENEFTNRDNTLSQSSGIQGINVNEILDFIS